MKRKFQHIIILALILLSVFAAVEKSAAKVVVEQCDTMEFSVTSRPNIDDTHFVWGIYNSSDGPTDVLDPAGTLDPAIHFVDGQYAGRSVKVVGVEPGRYYVRIHVWDEISCTDNIEMYVMDVIEVIPEVELYGDSVCVGEAATVRIVFSGVGPYNIEYGFGDENTGNVINLNGTVTGPEVTIPLTGLPAGPQTFWIISIEDDCRAYEYPIDERPTVVVIIYPKPRNSQIYLKE